MMVVVHLFETFSHYTLRTPASVHIHIDTYWCVQVLIGRFRFVCLLWCLERSSLEPRAVCFLRPLLLQEPRDPASISIRLSTSRGSSAQQQ